MSTPQSLCITVETPTGSDARTLALSDESCWANILGQWALPCAGAIDELDGLLSGGGARRILLTGCPSACLLPLLWIRTIWFPKGGPTLVIKWDSVEDPANSPGRQPAGKLACMLADELICDDPTSAWTSWGIDGSREIPFTEEAFDLLTNILDIWDSDLNLSKLGIDWNDSLQHALASCAQRGLHRVGIYGAGTHTRGVGDALLEPSVEIVCVIDDDTRRHGQRMWGYEIVSRERAIELGLDGVVISANSIEDQLWERCELFRHRGIETIRLYGLNPASETSTP